MSWVLGIVGNSIPEDFLQSIQFSCDSPIHSIQRSHDLLIVAGGSTDTLHCIDTSDTCAIVTGCGISISDSSSTILDTVDWKLIIDQHLPPLTTLNGNFTIIRYRNKILECYSDKVGLRTLYFGKYKHWWIFSSRLSLVTRFLPETKIDWSVFGPRWISFNQFSFNSQIIGVERLPSNGYIKIEKGLLSKNSKPWLLHSRQTTSSQDAKKILFALTKNETKHIRIGMSGGLDSRTLLATVSSRTKNFSTYTFGHENEPDVIFARKIAASENIPYENFYSALPAMDECIHFLHHYIHQTNLVGDASMAARLRYYPLMKRSNAVQIDGGNGEIARRQFLNRLYIFAYNDILNLNLPKILSYSLRHRADIFNVDTNKHMMNGTMNELDHLIHSLPSPMEIGVDIFLDSWAAQINIPNIACDEQARIDEYVLNYMPYSQPDFINNALTLPLRERKNNKLFKKIITETKPSLSKFPLIKNSIQYPYNLTMLQMRVWSKIQSIFHNAFVDNIPFLLLDTLKDYIMDTLHSQTVREYAHYDLRKISASVNGYYNGKKHLAGEVNWWIAFEIWRQSVENKKAGH